MLYKTDFWKNGEVKKYNFEFDSRCPDSIYIPQIKKALEESTSNSLLQQKDCTWAFLGDGMKDRRRTAIFSGPLLTRVRCGARKQIPVLIQTGDGRYYVSETTTGVRIKNGGTHNGDTYIAVSDHLNYNQYKAVLRNGKEYNSLEEAYKAYVTALADSKYNGVRDTQASAP